MRPTTDADTLSTFFPAQLQPHEVDITPRMHHYAA